MLYFLALAWHSAGGHATAVPARRPAAALELALLRAACAAAYTAVLFLAGIFGERPKSGKEVILATQRALEQQALERWRMQKEAQIEQMMRDGLPLGAVAAALASPETAERIALMEAATSGSLSPLDAARLSLRRAGQDSAVLDGLLAPAPLRDGLHGRGRGGVARPFGTRPPRLAVVTIASAATMQHADDAGRNANACDGPRRHCSRTSAMLSALHLHRCAEPLGNEGLSIWLVFNGSMRVVTHLGNERCGSVGHLVGAASSARLVTRKSGAGRGPVKAAATGARAGSGTPTGAWP